MSTHLKNETHMSENRPYFKDTRKKLREVAQVSKGEAKEMLDDAEYQVKLHSLEARDALTNYITHSPLTAMGIAMLSGAILALLLKR